MWKTALNNSTNVELEQTTEARAPRAAYKQRLGKPGSSSKTTPAHYVGMPRSGSWNPRTMRNGDPITELYPNMQSLKVKPGLMTKFYIDDIRTISTEKDDKVRESTVK